MAQDYPVFSLNIILDYMPLILYLSLEAIKNFIPMLS